MNDSNIIKHQYFFIFDKFSNRIDGGYIGLNEKKLLETSITPFKDKITISILNKGKNPWFLDYAFIVIPMEANDVILSDYVPQEISVLIQTSENPIIQMNNVLSGLRKPYDLDPQEIVEFLSNPEGEPDFII